MTSVPPPCWQQLGGDRARSALDAVHDEAGEFVVGSGRLEASGLGDLARLDLAHCVRDHRGDEVGVDGPEGAGTHAVADEFLNAASREPRVLRVHGGGSGLLREVAHERRRRRAERIGGRAQVGGDSLDVVGLLEHATLHLDGRPFEEVHEHVDRELLFAVTERVERRLRAPKPGGEIRERERTKPLREEELEELVQECVATGGGERRHDPPSVRRRPEPARSRWPPRNATRAPEYHPPSPGTLHSLAGCLAWNWSVEPPVQGHEVVIVDAVRTPIGRGHPEKGQFRSVHPAALLGRVYAAVLDRSGLDPELVETVLAGCVMQIGPQGSNIARTAWLHEGLPIDTSAVTLDLQCGSAQHAVGLAAAQIACGMHGVAIAAGVEHMGCLGFSAVQETQERYGEALTPTVVDRHPIAGQGIGAELIADDWSLTRVELDALSVRSHQRAAAAVAAGRFDREIVPVQTPEGLVTTDQGIRPDTSMEALSRLRPVFKDDGVLTAGSSSQISDGAAAVLLMRADLAAKHGVPIRARIVDHVTVGCDPVRMLEGPIPATAQILARNDLEVDAIDRFEVNEAFASVVLAWQQAHDPPVDRVNVNGGAIALGHPVGATGARLITSLLHDLESASLARGLVTMCCGGGLGTGTLIELR